MTTREKFYENLKKFNYEMVNPNQEIKNIQDKVLLRFEGKEYESVFRNFADGYLPHRNNSNRIKTIERFKEKVFELVGDEFEVLDGEVYVNNKTPIKMKHKKCGNIITTLTPNTFLSGKRCKHCAGHYTPTLEEVKKLILEKRGTEYEIADDSTYKDLSKQKTKIRHNTCGNVYEVHIDSLLEGYSCPKCFHADVLKTQEQFEQEVFEKYGDKFKVISKYTGTNDPIDIECTKCKSQRTMISNYLISPNNFIYCLKCNPDKNSSMEELSVRNFIEDELNIKTKKIRKRIDKKLYEIDIFIESLNIGIEFNGNYWHSEGIASNKLNLFDKMTAYNKKNIRIINIFEDEWLYKREIVKEKLRNILKANTSEKIFARKCIIKEVSSKEKNEFLNKYHIQGEDKSNISKGLFYNGELVAVMTFTKLRNSLGNKIKQNNVYELSRFASSKPVVGGFSKLFKNILDENNSIEKVITYADLRWSSENDNVYLKNGFSLLRKSKPSYWYVAGSIRRYHRYNFRKQVLKEKFPEFYDDSLTEHQIMDKTNYRRIWDCGNLVYEWKRKDD